MVVRRWMFVVVILALFVRGQAGFGANDVTTYKSKGNGFALRFPSSWNIQEQGGGTTVQAVGPLPAKAKGPFRPTVTVRVETLSKAMTLDEYIDLTMSKNRARKQDFRIHGTGRQTVSHTKARWWIISYRADAGTVKGFLFVLLKGKKAFTVTCVSALDQFPSYESAFEDVVESLWIK